MKRVMTDSYGTYRVILLDYHFPLMYRVLNAYWRNSYRHIITGAKKEHPVESRGGIIADEMGLGKSLVILAAIVGSRERSSAFVLSTSNMQQNLKRSGATLIIAPSSRM